MKIQIYKTILLLTALTLSGSDAARAQEHFLPDNTNPALLYWREFSVMPEVNSKQVEELSKSSAITTDHLSFISKFDATFRRLSKVRRFTGECDWGDDLDEGAFILLPYLSKARDVAKVAQLRARVHFKNGEDKKAVDELLSVYTLGGHIADSPILINLLVHFSMDKICTAIIAENLSLFSNDSLTRLKAGIDASPKGKSIADTISTERQFMAGWLRSRLSNLITLSSNSPSVAFTKAESLIRQLFEAKNGDKVWDDFKAAGGTSVEALIKLLDNSDSDYKALESLCWERNTDFSEQIAQFESANKTSGNPVRRWLFPAIAQSRTKEIGNLILNEMVLTAINSRLSGEAAFGRSKDPIGGSAFKRSAFVHEGEKVGFILESKFTESKNRQHLFLHKPIRGLNLSGPDIGTSTDD
jgi:hypothetical protein